jgi:D-glycero-alpha-D-manno-heptose 1-phosphate guanylyltransferase
MEVIILAGGLGTRLRSVVSEVPKCMAPVDGKPFLWYLLKYLTHYEVSRVILSVGYLRDVIIDWIDENGQEFPFGFDYAIEEEPLGTGGGICLALSKTFGSDIVVLNGDTFFEVNLNELMDYHHIKPATISMALKPMCDFDRYGRVVIDKIDGRVVEFKEKEFCNDGLINGGVYVINKHELPQGLPVKFSFEREVLEPLCTKSKVYGLIQEGYFIDIGVPEDYKLAQSELSQNK